VIGQAASVAVVAKVTAERPSVSVLRMTCATASRGIGCTNLAAPNSGLGGAMGTSVTAL